jgi:protein-S-isoprenylcysteine O-methyltransferase Ste14
VVALGLLVVPEGLLNPRIVPSSLAIFGLIIQILGMAVSVWARVHLGRYWSGSVTIKVSHELIESGPYHWVRHPIYTGLVLQMLGCSLTVGTLLALLTAPILYVGYRIKGSQEETLLRGQFGERYARYAEKIPALLPWPWPRTKDQ